MTTDLDDLVGRLERLEDLEAVRACWLDYCNRLDLEDFDALADVFTEDAQLEANRVKGQSLRDIVAQGI